MVIAEGQPQTAASNNTPVYDVVFVVEAAAALCGYFDSVKTNYILPILEYFNGGPPDEIDYGCDYSCTLYSLVLYRSGDSAPEPASSCIRPTTSTYKFINSLDQIRFYGGAGEAYSHMSEGLATALQVFDDLSQIRGPYVTTQKHCIVVCNSPGYQLPSQESFSYAGLLPDQLALKLTEKEVNFSVMAPRKMPALLRLFDKANPDSPSSQMKNFTVDSRHLVLLKGFALQERPQSPSIVKKEEASVDTKSSAGSTGNGTSQQQPSPASSQGGNVPRMTNPTSIGPNRPNAPTMANVQQTAAHEEAKKILQHTQIIAGAAGQTRQNQPGAVQPPQQQPQQTMNIMPVSQPSMMTGQQSFPGQPGIRAQTINQMGMSTIGQMAPQAAAAGLMTQQQQPPMTSQPGQFSGINTTIATQPSVMPGTESIPGQGNLISDVDINNPQRTLENAAMQQQQQQQRRVIWNGALEWTERPKSDQPSNALAATQKITRSMACNVSVAPTDPDVNAAKWPNKLIMQLIPQQLLQPLSSLFKASRKVYFSFSNGDVESFKGLYRVMANGIAGYVHFPATTQTEVRLLMLLYSARQRHFMGLIPNDQSRFVQAMKTIITKHKQLQTFKNQAAGVSQGMQQVPSQQVGAAMGGMGTAMPNTMPNTTLGGMLGASQQVSNMAGMAGGQVQQGQQMTPDDRPNMGMPGTFDMSGNMAGAGAPGGIQQQQMITPGQQQQAFARQQQQQLLAQQQRQQLQQQQQQRMQLQLQQQQQQQMGHQQQLKHLLMNQQQQQQLRQQQQQQLMMQQQRGPRPVGPQTGMIPGPQGMPQQQTQSFMSGDSFDLPDLGL